MYTNEDLKISLYVQIHLISYLENLAFLLLINFELFNREVCVFLKNEADF